MSHCLSSTRRVQPLLARMPPYTLPLGSGQYVCMSPDTCGSWGKSGRIRLGVPGISLSQLSPEHALPPKLGTALALSVESCGPIPNQPPQTCHTTIFSPSEIESWLAGNGRGIGGEALFPTIFFSAPINIPIGLSGKSWLPLFGLMTPSLRRCLAR